MAKILFVIAPQNFRDDEYFVPKEILESNNIEVATASKITGKITGAGGKVAEAAYKTQDIDPENYNGVVFIGGPGMVEMTNDPEFVNLAKKFYEAKKLTTAICAAAAVLANADLLRGKKATSWSGVAEVLKSSGANYTGNPVEIDGNIITGDGPQSAKIFGEAIAKALSDKN